jgi:glycosyltransferase involved in cell wall biosynthesis
MVKKPMRIVLELQALPVPAAQHKDVDHYSASLARAMIAQPGNHDIHIVVNHSSADAIEDLQNKFPDLVQNGNFRVWQLPYSGAPKANSHWRHGAAKLLREHWLLQLKPDVVLCGLSTGTCDAGVLSELRFAGVPTAITLHELFPSLNRETYASDPFVSDPSMQERSALCVEQLREADLVLTISGYCRGQILDALGLQPESVVAIPPAADVRFRCRAVSAEHERAVRMRFALNHDLVMSVGGTAYRKNIEGLIEAYALLPFELRKGHQLAVVGRIDDDAGRRLHGLARSKGLADGELTMTGYVSDEELVTLYNICKVFVFPSLREVFSLPPLEAMSCGAPVIGSNRTSIPEVIGLAEALFDPVSTPSMSEKIYKVLTDTEFRAKLKAHGMEQARRFSWQESARQALDALEALHFSRRETRRTHPPSPKSRPRLAYISPLPPERSGIADYSAELLPELAKYYEIDLITDLARIDDPYLQKGFRRRPMAEFERSAHRYDRVLYHIGNSPFHRQIPSFLQRYPGSVVLHDFFLSHLFNYLERVDGSKALQRSLYMSHGYPGLLKWARKGAEAAIWTYPCNLSVLSQAQGIIVHSEHAKQLARGFSISAENWAVIPQLRRIPKIISREDARRALGIPPKKFLVCSFGFLAPTKLNERLFDSWLASSLVNRKDCHLVFVGGDGEGKPYQVDGPWSSQIRVTGYLGKEDYQRYLFAADVGVQLRGVLSRGETPRSVFDCMAHGLATIVNAHPMLADLPADSVTTLSEDFGIGELVGALERFYRDPEYRTELGQGAQQYVRDKLDPALIARQYADAVEKFAADHPVALTSRLVVKIAGLPAAPLPSDDDLASVASCIAENSVRSGPRQLLVDITILSTCGDFRTGIQRVTRGILSQLLEKPPNGYRVEAVYRRFGQVYHYARDFMFKSLGLEPLSLDDAPVTVYPGDIFLGLDWDSGIDEPAYTWLLHHRQRGMAVHFVVYDLLPWRHADWFPTEMKSNFLSWLSGLSRVATGFVCISRATADELLDWLEIHQPTSARALDVGYFHLGSDIEESWPSRGLDAPTRILLEKLEDQDVFMMIGTVEPRKGHSQVLSAMERLWAEGEDVCLLIFGKQGWMVESMAQRLRSHAELGRRLFWLDHASDEALLQLYSIASVILMASEGEGFGLPLVEAARQGVPIIARDLRVFREIAGEHAFYFSGTDPADLASALRTWLNLYRRGEHPKSDKLPWLTWEESTQEFLRVLLQGKLYKHWRPARTLFFDESAPQTADGRPAEPERDSLGDSDLGTDYTPNGAGTALPAAILASRR